MEAYQYKIDYNIYKNISNTDMFGFGPGTGMQPQRMPTINYQKQLRVYPASFAFRQDIQIGDKILLPQSALNQLYPLMSKGPLIFCITNLGLLNPKRTYCGVLQFVAEQGLCYIPNWMFKMLNFMEEGAPAQISLVQDLRTKKVKTPYFIKLQPHKTKFIQLDNPKAVLEYQLRNFTCLHEGDTITITTFSGKFQIDIVQIKPKNAYDAICIIDTDVQVDFAPPLDYQETKPQQHTGKLVEENSKKSVFDGKGVRIDQKAANPGRKASQAIQQEEYDPRKHRIHRGVRKSNVSWTGGAVKIGIPTGTKR